MSKRIQTADRSQSGFTLVELAIVMIIIGLLIGGVLKGQELIKNAQITATVAQVKSSDAATSSFRDMFNAIPGDMANEQARLPNCTAAPCAAAGDGNGQLNSAPDAAPGAEADAYFVQLSAADLISGIDPNLGCTVWGGCYPESKSGGGAGVQIGYWGGGAIGDSANAPRGHYLAITTNIGAAPAPTSGAAALTPNQAFRIDSKVDDGQPSTGSVVSVGGTCMNTANGYDELLASAECDLLIRIQS